MIHFTTFWCHRERGENEPKRQPHKLPLREYNNRTTVDGLAKILCAVPDLREVVALLVLNVGLELEDRDEAPDEAGAREEDWRDNERVVVAQAEHKICSCKGPAGAGDLVEDVDGGIHATELVDVAADNVPRDDTPDELDHAVGYTGGLQGFFLLEVMEGEYGGERGGGGDIHSRPGRGRSGSSHHSEASSPQAASSSRPSRHPQPTTPPPTVQRT